MPTATYVEDLVIVCLCVRRVLSIAVKLFDQHPKFFYIVIFLTILKEIKSLEESK